MKKLYSIICSAIFTQKEAERKHGKIIYRVSTHDTYDEAAEALKELNVEDHILKMNERIFKHWITDKYESKVVEIKRHTDEENPWICVVSTAHNVADATVVTRRNVFHIVEVPFE